MWFYDGDGDGYHSDKKTSTGSPDESGFWFTTSEGPDCDDDNRFKTKTDDCKPFVEGKTKLEGHSFSDTRKLKADIDNVLKDTKFDKFKELIKRAGKAFEKINLDTVKETTKDLEGDDLLLVKIIMEVLNSNKPLKFEYLSNTSESVVSEEGTKAEVNYFNELQTGFGNKMIPGNQASVSIIQGLGKEGYTVGKKGINAHAFVLTGTGINHFQDKREITSFHEIFGHALMIIKNASDEVNNTFTLQLENLTRRVCGISDFRNGKDHAGGQINNPKDKPKLK